MTKIFINLTLIQVVVYAANIYKSNNEHYENSSPVSSVAYLNRSLTDLSHDNCAKDGISGLVSKFAEVS